jgi:hypothetical protein
LTPQCDDAGAGTRTIYRPCQRADTVACDELSHTSVRR